MKYIIVLPSVVWILAKLFVRLMNGGTSAGRVEVYHGSDWGTVCDDGWDDIDATVVCKQLGFYRGEARGDAYYGEGSGQIVLKTVACKGDETQFGQCSFPSGIGDFSSTCSHAEDAGVECFSGADVMQTLRLIDGNSSSGRVEIYGLDQWGSVCDEGWDDKEAQVVCRDLRRAGGVAVSGGKFGQSAGASWIVDCSGTEQSIADCTKSIVRGAQFSCTHSRDAGVICGERLQTLRLAGSSSTTGRVEIYRNGQWGTICENGWGRADAEVVCRQLGLAGGTPRYNSFYGGGTGPIWMTELACSGQEAYIETASCMGSFSWGDYSDICNHNQDAGVDCIDPKDVDLTQTTPSGGGGGGGGVYVIATFDGDIRLVGQATGGAVVEVKSSSKWHKLCANDWDLIDGKVVCQQAGYTDIISVAIDSTPQNVSGLMGFSPVSCSGSELSLAECLQFSLSNTTCEDGMPGQVQCSTIRYQEGDIRLSKGSMKRIQIFKNGEWNYMCADANSQWDVNAAKVVCRQVNGQEGIPNFGIERFEYGATRLKSVSCSGDETEVNLCSMSLRRRTSCTDYAIVRCDTIVSESSIGPGIVAVIVITSLVAIVVIIVLAIMYCNKKQKLIPTHVKTISESGNKGRLKTYAPTNETSFMTKASENGGGGDVLEKSEAGRPLPAVAAPVDRARKAARKQGSGSKLPPIWSANALPDLKPKSKRISSATPRVFTPRSEGSSVGTLTPRSAWKEDAASPGINRSSLAGAIPPPASYDAMPEEKKKTKKKKKVYLSKTRVTDSTILE